MKSSQHPVSQYDKLLSGPLPRTFVHFEKDIIDTQPNSAGIATVSSALPPRRKIILRDSVTIGGAGSVDAGTLCDYILSVSQLLGATR